MKVFLCIVTVLLLVSASEAGGKLSGTKGGNLRTPYDINVVWAKHIRQGSNLKIWFSNQGIYGESSWDNQAVPPDDCSPTTGIACVYPATSCFEHLFGAGPFIAALVDGSPRVTQGYNGNSGIGEFLPNLSDTARDRIRFASIDSAAAPNKKGFDDDGDGAVDEDELDGTDNDGDWNPLTDDVGADGLVDSLETGCNGGYDPVNNPDPAFDNYEPSIIDLCRPDPYGRYLRKNKKDIYTQNNGLSDHGEPHVDEDYGAYSQSDYYCSYTDTFTTPVYSTHKKNGIKVWQKSYSWEYGSAADAIVMMEYTFINVGSQFLTDVYLGMFADMDIGSTSIPNFYNLNYSVYDRETRTGYICTPVERGGTPLGLTLLATSSPLDSLKQIYQWHDYSPPCGGTDDSLIYDCYSGAAFPDSLIKENQPLSWLNDTRFFLSNGPFAPLQPGDTATITYAFVGGMTVDDVLGNAKRAHRIYEAKGFIMPNILVQDSGLGKKLHITWKRIPRSPFGNVVSYTVLFGEHSGQYTDSVITTDLFCDRDDSMKGQTRYVVVRAMDEHGNYSALSDEATLVPLSPDQPFVLNEQTSLTVYWSRNREIDLVGYNIYRRILPDTTFVKIVNAPSPDTVFIDVDVWGDKQYSYRITAVDQEGNESPFSFETQGALLAPAVPTGLVAGSTPSLIRVAWFRNLEGDLAGYKLYRSSMSDTTKNLVAVLPPACTLYTDSVIEQGKYYYYYMSAIDTTDAESPKTTPEVSGIAKQYPKRILIIDGSYPKNDTTLDLYQGFFNGYSDTIEQFYVTLWNSTYRVPYLSSYSTIFWLQDEITRNDLLTKYPLALKGFLLGEHNLVIMGRRLLTQYYQFWYPFLNEFFGVDLTAETDSSFTFIGAAGYQGFPPVSIDTTKNKPLNYIERFPGIASDRVVYRYQSSPYNPHLEGMPVGIRALDTSLHAYYLSFPIKSLDSASARALFLKFMDEFGETPLAVKEEISSLPERFELLRNFPNPFNPSTNIRFSIPSASIVTVKIFDLLGREVTTLIQDHFEPGIYTVPWNAGNSAAGIYYCRFTATDDRMKQVQSQTTKLVYMK